MLGVETGIFGLYRNYLEDISIGNLTSRESQQMFTLYFAIFAFGRLAGSYIQKKIKPSVTLTFSLVAALILTIAIILTHGWASIVAITAIGFFVSIFFPTLYSIAIEGQGDRTGQASGILTLGFLGVAILPILQGKLADTFGLQFFFCHCNYSISVCPILCTEGYAFKSFRLKSSFQKNI